jgi:hypothetical protein
MTIEDLQVFQDFLKKIFLVVSILMIYLREVVSILILGVLVEVSLAVSFIVEVTMLPGVQIYEWRYMYH